VRTFRHLFTVRAEARTTTPVLISEADSSRRFTPRTIRATTVAPFTVRAEARTIALPPLPFERSENFPSSLYRSSGSENYLVRTGISGREFSSLRSSNDKGNDRGSLYCSSGSENYPLYLLPAKKHLQKYLL
jgi:hypothetical protein